MQTIDYKKQELQKGLYLISTPIGNLLDITIRAIDILERSDVILCEDTRVSKKLLEYYNIKTKLISYHKFNEKESLEKVLDIIKKEKIVSLISDCGTPLVSDPGRLLINEAYKNNIKIIPIPGPSAVTAAFSVSGFSDDYYFSGFLSKKLGERKIFYEKIKDFQSSVIMFVPARDLKSILIEMQKYLDDREVLIAKEITKIYENFVKSKLSEILDKLENFFIKGEITLVLSSSTNKNNGTNIDLDKEILTLSKKMKISDIAKYLSDKLNIPKKIIYSKALSLKKKQ